MDIYGNKLVNTMETKPLCISTSNLTDMLTTVRVWTLVSSTGRDQSSLCDTPLSVCPSVRLSVRPSVNNSCYRISSEAIYHRDFIMVPVCWPYGVVVHLQF